MGALATRGRGGSPEEFGIVSDLGPQETVVVPEGVYSLKAMLASVGADHFLRHRNSELWADAKESLELYDFDATFVLVPGLLGYAHSLRSTNYPLEFVRQQDSRLFIGEYDGSYRFRSDATFELRASVDTSAKAAKATNEAINSDGFAVHDVCFMSASCPGKYLRIDTDNRAVLDKYDFLNQVAYQFHLVKGLALKWASDLGEPLVLEHVVADSSNSTSDDSRQLQPSSAEQIVDQGIAHAATIEPLPSHAQAPSHTRETQDAPCEPVFSLPGSNDEQSTQVLAQAGLLAARVVPALRLTSSQSPVSAMGMPRRAPPELGQDTSRADGQAMHSHLPVLEFEVVD